MSTPSSPSRSTRTYEIEHADGGRVRIEVDESWKVTYGPIVGAGKALAVGGMAFRVWESETKQRMLLTNINSFRDVSIPVTVEAIRPFGWATWHRITDEWRTPENLEKVERAWKPVDEVEERGIRPRDLPAQAKVAADDEEDEDPVVPMPKPASWRSPITARKP